MPPADIIVQAITSFLVSFVVFTCVSQILQREEHHRQVVRDIEDRTPPTPTPTTTTTTTERIPMANARDGGPFTAVAACPRCGDYYIHRMRPPNTDPPHFHDLSDETVYTFGGQHAYSIGGPSPDRWDERPYEVVRTCNNCDHEFGHV